jgi:hypothetical protein
VSQKSYFTWETAENGNCISSASNSIKEVLNEDLGDLFKRKLQPLN